MGLLKASIIMVAGLFILSLLENNNNINMVCNIPIIGSLYGENIKKYIKKHNCMVLLISICVIEFIL
jgi:hypothetical protein